MKPLSACIRILQNRHSKSEVESTGHMKWGLSKVYGNYKSFFAAKSGFVCAFPHSHSGPMEPKSDEASCASHRHTDFDWTWKKCAFCCVNRRKCMCRNWIWTLDLRQTLNLRQHVYECMYVFNAWLLWTGAGYNVSKERCVLISNYTQTLDLFQDICK